MHGFGAVHIYEFRAGLFGKNPKLRPCIVSSTTSAKRGLQPNLPICPRTTDMDRNRKNIQEGLAFRVPKGTPTDDHNTFRFSKEGVFIMCVVQSVPASHLEAETYCGRLPKQYVAEAHQCAANCKRWWWERRKGRPPQN